jgi:phosphohistidine phosphatase
MNLYIIRHAIAVEAGTPEFEDDSLRPLTDKGKKKMQKIARGLKELDAEIDLVITSPYVRAVGTSEILRKEFDLKKEEVVETEYLSPVGYGDQLIHWISEKYADVQNIALVGHEPSLSNLVSILLTGDPNLSLTLKKGGVCRLSVDTLQYGRCATLEWLFYPSQLAEFGA